MRSSVSPSTQTTYSSAYQAFVKFTLLNSLPQKVTEDTLSHFVIYCHDSLNLRFETIKLYLCGIRYHLLLQGAENPFTSSEGLPRLQMLMNGIKRQHKACHPKRKPITTRILSDFVSVLQQGVFTPYSDLLMSTVCVVAFFGFLRCAEFTCKSSFDPDCNLCLNDLKIYENYAILTLKQSKTDPFRKGIDVKLFQTYASLCPVQQCTAYLSKRNTIFSSAPHDPLFIMENGKPLTRSDFLTMLNELLTRTDHADSGISGHSFRIGAATSAAEARIEDHLIKSMGRWSSDSYLRYIRTDNAVIQNAQISMLHPLNHNKQS